VKRLKHLWDFGAANVAAVPGGLHSNKTREANDFVDRLGVAVVPAVLAFL